ncbi:tetratricopeptide repeat protein, partial [Streptosporangium sp. NPDC002721]|uniref:tetratricopeptide repeat protein n=1 Tax=Streptosporangium sp. NPDC002721 TaxID=3366188 RepID=UPI00367A5ED8
GEVSTRHGDGLPARQSTAHTNPSDLNPVQALGRLEEAEAEHRAVLEISRRVLGEEHPHTLFSRGNLAGVLRDLGRLEESQVLE